MSPSRRPTYTNKTIEAWVDNESSFYEPVKIDDHKISLRWEMELMPPFGFATYDTQGGFRKIVIKPLDEE